MLVDCQGCGPMVPTLTRAFPQKVAPKNFQKGIWKWPQQMPHRSKSALGHAASRKIPQNPFLQVTQNCWNSGVLSAHSIFATSGWYSVPKGGAS